MNDKTLFMANKLNSQTIRHTSTKKAVFGVLDFIATNVVG